jgi:pyruvate,water dikinase
VEVPEGTNVLLLLGSANHDERIFPDPGAIDLRRSNARSHLAFGYGIHFCLGAALARLEGQVVLEELTQRLPGLRLVDGQIYDYSANTTFRCPLRVLAEWDDAASETATTADPGHVRRFEECRSGDVALVGGKAASLGELLAAQLPVPSGFAVTTRAYLEHLRAGGLGDWVRQELASLDATDVEALEATAARVRARIEAAPLPEAVAEAITAAYAQLGDMAPVAVRSSATAEDSADASFAGQQDTYLWVRGLDDVLHHVKRCWASLYSGRSLVYRHDRGIAHGEVLMGVAVQRMVVAEAAGVAMTLNPGNGDRSKVAVESSFGLGEAVVGGEVTPDSFMVDKVVLEIVSTSLSSKHVEIVPDPAGTGVVRHDVEPERQLLPSISPEQVKAVAALAKRAERHYGCPQDVEWALDGAASPPVVVLLQSRPETVWARKAATTPSRSYVTGLAGIVSTLNNPLAARREPRVDTDR